MNSCSNGNINETFIIMGDTGNTGSDIFLTGGSYSNGVLTLYNNSGSSVNVTGFYTGATDVFVTGGTYSAGTITLQNNTGGTSTISGFYTGATDVFVTGGTYSAGTITLQNNTGGTSTISGLYTGNTLTWSLTGNTFGGNSGYFLGTLGNDDVIIKRNSIDTFHLYSDGNIGIGGYSWANAFVSGRSHSNSIVIGNSAGSYSTGDREINIGYNAGILSNSTSSIAIGSEVGQNSTLNGSIILGSNAGISSNIIRSFVAGSFAGSGSNITEGVVIGYNAGIRNNIYSFGDLVIGRFAGYQNQVSGSLFLGSAAGYYASGYNSTFIGSVAGGNSNTSTSVFIGENTGRDSTGIFNNAIGSKALSGNTGSFVEAIGYLAGVNNSHSSVVLLGAGASATSDNQLVISNSINNINAKGFPTGVGYVLTDTNGDGILTLKPAQTASGQTITGGTMLNNILTLRTASGSSINIPINSFTGLTVSGNVLANSISATTISASTLYGNGSNLTGIPNTFVTGGTYSAGTITLRNNTGGTSTISGLYTGATDVFVTGGTYTNGTITLRNNTGGTSTISGLYTGATDVFVTGGTYSAGTITLRNNTGGTSTISGLYTGATDVFVTGGTYNFQNGIISLSRSDDSTVQIYGLLREIDVWTTTGNTLNGSEVLGSINDIDLRLVRNNKTSALFNTNHLLLGYSVAENFDINSLSTPLVLVGNNSFSNQNGLFFGSVIAIGESAGARDDAGYTIQGDSIYIGQNAGKNDNGFSSNIILGHQSGVNNSFADVIILGNSANATNSGQLVISDNITEIKAAGIPSGAGYVLTDVIGDGILTLQPVSGGGSGDRYITGGTYTNGSLNLSDNSGNTVTVNGFYTGATDVRVTGGTYSAGTITLKNNTGGTFTVTGLYTGATDVFVTGGTYSSGTITLRNNTGGTSTISGLYTGATDVFVTGGTYSAGTITLRNNTGGTFTVTGLYTGGTDVYVTGGTYSAGTITLRNNTGGTSTISGLYTGATDITITGGTYSAGTLSLVNNTGGTISINNFNTGTTVTGLTFNNNILSVYKENDGILTTLINNFSGITTPTITSNTGGTLTFYVGTGGTTQALTFNSSAAATFASSITSASNIIGLNVLSDNLVRAGTDSSLQIRGRFNIYAKSDSSVLFQNGSSNDTIPRLVFGQQTTSYSSMRVTGTTTEFRLGDDSADASISTGGINIGYVTKTVAYTASTHDTTIDCTSGTFTVTLPTAVGRQKKVYIIKNTGAGTITVGTTSSQTIDGSTTKSLSTNAWIMVQSTGANWIIIG